ncbi:MAG TPA: hypothetical protein DHV36_19675 [Desulfobacteraceae bacterium]|nr:hypothetical protein [Desulfobacteraceae bacterium]
MDWELLFAAVAVAGASVIRGYTGFGFAMVCALCLALVFPPATVTPVILCLDILGSLWLFLKAYHLVDWRGLSGIILGAAVTLPLGTMALVHVPVTPVRIFISLIILSAAIALLGQKTMRSNTGPWATAAVGMGAGFLSGLAALGGPPVILFYYSSDRPVDVSRASMIAFFLVVDILAISACVAGGLVSERVIQLSLWMAVPLILGIWLGNALFQKFRNEAAFRRQVIWLLIGLSVVSLGKSIIWG